MYQPSLIHCRWKTAFLLIKERSTRIKTEISFMAGQPTPPPPQKKKKNTYPP